MLHGFGVALLGEGLVALFAEGERFAEAPGVFGLEPCDLGGGVFGRELGAGRIGAGRTCAAGGGQQRCARDEGGAGDECSSGHALGLSVWRVGGAMGHWRLRLKL
ncbi:MAG: hypothetical protein ACFHWZ_08555 [Phycisphaerales bacterium]